MTQSPRFVADDPAHAVRVAAGGRLVIGVGSWLLSGLGMIGWRRPLHNAERMWGHAAAGVVDARIDIAGVGHIDPGERYLVVSLQEGFADVLALFRLPLPLRFAVRDELFEWPALGRYLRTTRQVRIDDPGDRASVRRLYRDIGEVFASGESLVVFPQGSILGIEVAFQTGAFHLARHFGRPILPVVVTGSHRIWEHPYTPKVRLGQRITMQVLEPIPAEALDGPTAIGLEREMKTLALEPGRAPVRRFYPERDGWWDGYRYEIDPRFTDLAARVEHRRMQDSR